MEEKKRLLCIVSAMNAGGAETFLMKIFRALNKEKYQMDFCVNDDAPGLYDQEIRRLGGEVYVIPAKSQNIIRFKKALKSLIRQKDYQYVLRIASNGMGFLDLKIAKKNGVQRCIARSSNSSDGGGIKVAVAHFFGKVFYSRYIDKRIAPSDLAAIYTFGQKKCKTGAVSILHNAVDLREFNYSKRKRAEVRSEFNIREGSFIIGHIGRLSKQKNHAFLLDIFFQLRKQNPNAILLLVGMGELEETIKAKAASLNLTEHIIFAGIRTDIVALLSSMDVFVFPSLYEGMPNTVIEAQATGLPCIISDTITKTVDITGLVMFKSLNDSALSWAEEIVKYKDSPRRDTHDCFVENKYDIESVTREFEKIIFE